MKRLINSCQSVHRTWKIDAEHNQDSHVLSDIYCRALFCMNNWMSV